MIRDRKAAPIADQARDLTGNEGPLADTARDALGEGTDGRAAPFLPETAGGEDRESRIRARAHRKWEEAGYPEGEHERHWNDAEREIDSEDGMPAEAQR